MPSRLRGLHRHVRSRVAAEVGDATLARNGRADCQIGGADEQQAEEGQPRHRAHRLLHTVLHRAPSRRQALRDRFNLTDGAISRCRVNRLVVRCLPLQDYSAGVPSPSVSRRTASKPSGALTRNCTDREAGSRRRRGSVADLPDRDEDSVAPQIALGEGHGPRPVRHAEPRKAAIHPARPPRRAHVRLRPDGLRPRPHRQRPPAHRVRRAVPHPARPATAPRA